MSAWKGVLILSLFLVLACGSVEDPAIQPGAVESPPAGGDGLTYTRDILPIIEVRCAPCHNPTSGLPNWLDYNTAFQKKDLIRKRVFVLQDMPFENKTNMTLEERALFAQWIDGGAQK